MRQAQNGWRKVTSLDKNVHTSFEVSMNKLKDLWEEAHSNAGQTPDLHIDLLSVGSIFESNRDFFGSAWDWVTRVFGSLGATIAGWILKVVLGIALLILLCCCLVTWCGKIFSGTITRAVAKQLEVLGPVESVMGHESGLFGVIGLRDLNQTELSPIVEDSQRGEEEPELHSTLRCQYSEVTII